MRFGTLLAAIFMISSLNPGPGMNSKEKLRDEIQPRGGGPVPELAALAGSTCGPCCEDREKKPRAMGTSALLISFCVCACLLSTILFISPYWILSTLSLCHTGPPRARNVEDVLALMRLEI